MIARLVVDPGQDGAAEAGWAAGVLLSLTGLAWRAGDAGEGPIVFVGDPARAPGNTALVLPWRDPGPWTPAGLGLAMFEGVPVVCPGGRLDPPGDARVLPDPGLRSVFSLLSREEEWLEPARDRWECFAGTSSRLSALGVLERPLVNEFSRLLADRLARWALARHVTLAPLPLWPLGKRFAVLLSHDVDEVRFGSLVEAGRLLALARGPRSYAMRAGLAQEARGFGSSFYFCAPRPSERHEYDARYRLGDRVDFEGRRGTVASLMARLAGRGFDVGLHGSYLSHRDGPDLARQREQIAAASGRPAEGTRQHFLRFDIARTWRAQEEAGFAYDSTLGYNEAIGFRAGIAAPFAPWDVAAGRPHRLLELPLTVMDGALFRTMSLDGPQAAARVRAHLAEVEEAGGLAVLLWHPNGAHERAFPGWWQAWEAALDALSGRGAWVVDGRTIAHWWQERGRAAQA
ncbi:MAG: polysaccharide deacetylase family protein [Candidatus Eisenbacteria bacterium]